MFKKISLFLAVALIGFSQLSFEQQADPGDRLLGVWEPSNGRARVKIEKIGTKYYGKIQKPSCPKWTRTTQIRRSKVHR
jgi:hypothetical protein